MKTVEVSENPAVCERQREGFNPCRIRPQNLASKMPKINCWGLFGCAGLHFSKKRGGFSRASPPASSAQCDLLLNTPLFSSFMAGIDGLKNGLSISMKKFILATEIASLVFGGAGCANPAAPENIPNLPSIEGPNNPPNIPPVEPVGPNPGQNPVEPPEKPVVIEPEKPVFTPIADVKFDKVSSTLSSYDAMIKIKGKIIELINQSFELEAQYANLPTDDPANKNMFGWNMIYIQPELRNSYNRASVSSIIKSAPTCFRYMHNQLTSLLPEPAAKTLYGAQLDAFQKANVLAIRTRDASAIAKLAAEFETAWAASMGDKPLPMLAEPPSTGLTPIDAAQAVNDLRQVLLAYMPEGAGLPGPNVIQQIEDFAQFDGWTEDWEARFGKITGLDKVTVSAATNSEHVKLASLIHPTDAEVANAVAFGRKKETAESQGIVV